jgi:hypothetical protein
MPFVAEQLPSGGFYKGLVRTEPMLLHTSKDDTSGLAAIVSVTTFGDRSQFSKTTDW